MHKLLARQLRRKAGIDGAEALARALGEMGGLAAHPGLSADAAKLLAALPAVLSEIDAAYAQSDRDLELRRRSLEISSAELLEANDRLRVDAVKRQQELRQVEERLSLALTASDNAIWDWDVARNSILITSATDHFLGHPIAFYRDDARRLWSIVEPEDAPVYRERTVAHLQGRTPEFVMEAWMRNAGSDRRFVQMHGKVVERDGAGRALRMVGIAYDVTARKDAEDALRESEQKLIENAERLKIAHAAAKMIVLDLDIPTDTVKFSDSPEWLRGPLPADTGKYPVFKNQVHPDDRERFLATRQRAIDTLQPLSQEFRVVRTDGKVLWIRSDLTVFAGADGTATRLVSAMLDVTQRKRLEDDLLKAKNLAEAASLAKSQFLANMSHEIRTPMNGVLGMAELLLATSLDARQRHFAETVRRSGEALLYVINDILDFSKVEAGKLELDRVDFDLRETLEDVVQLLAEGAASKELELLCHIAPEIPVLINGDPNRIRQVATNLIGNALKFTEQGEVSLTVRILEQREDSNVLRFEIRDTGIGISAEAQARVFQPFSQADGSTTRRYGGTGLGLSISRELVGLMGGDIGLHSEVGKGTTFWFTARFGAASPAALDSQARDTGAALLAGRRVLIADDNATHRKVLCEQTAVTFGMRCTLAEDGVQAVALLREAARGGEPFDVALIDFDMPGLDGLAVASAVRADAALAKLPMVLLSSLHRSDRSGLARVAGFDAALTKPIRQMDLLSALCNALNLQTDLRAKTLEMQLAASDAPRFSGKVLVAEDNLVNQEVAQAVLQNCGCDVQLAANGREALLAIQNGAFDVIFMDCQMPEMDGYAATRAIRALEEQGMMRHVPIVALTAHATEADRQRCMEAGMDSFLTKPFTQVALHKELARWLTNTNTKTGEVVTMGNDQQQSPGAASEGLNQSALDELRALDPDGSGGILNELIQSYLADAPEQIGQLRAAIADKNIEAMSRAAQSMKSSSQTFGAMRVGELAREIESIGRANTIIGCDVLLAELEQQYAKAAKLLQACMTAPAA